MQTMRSGVVLLALLGSPVLTAQVESTPVDCIGPAPDAEPGTSEYFTRDANNVACGLRRPLDIAQHPVAPLPTVSTLLTVLPEQSNALNLAGVLAPVLTLDAPPGDPYRDPERHDDRRFRFEEVAIANRAGTMVETELYRPCSAQSCEDLPEVLDRFEAPYPAVVVVHGGGSRKELSWWASQPLAEAGYMVFAPQIADDHFNDVEDVVDWLFSTPENPTESGDFNPHWQALDRDRVGITGHSRGGQVASVLGQEDERISAIVAWDRGPTTPLPDALDTPSLFFVADYDCQSNPVCVPEPYPEPPDPSAGPGDEGRGQEYDIVQAAGVDSMKIVLRAATHLDWTPPLVTGSQLGEAVSVYYTLAWFDRYLRGRDDAATAERAHARLTAPVFDDSADRHNISVGTYDPAAALAEGDPFAGNVPYSLEGMPVEDRLSFYFRSQCDIGVPGEDARAQSTNMRMDGCTAQLGQGDAGGGTLSLWALCLIGIAAVFARIRLRREPGRWS